MKKMVLNITSNVDANPIFLNSASTVKSKKPKIKMKVKARYI